MHLMEHKKSAKNPVALKLRKGGWRLKMLKYFVNRAGQRQPIKEFSIAGRPLAGIYRSIFGVTAIFFSLFYLYLAGPAFLGIPGTGLRRGLFMLLICALVFMKYPAMKTSPQDRFTLWDVFLMVTATFTFGYWIVEFRDMIFRYGNPNSADILFGTLAILLSLEITRRVLGWVLVLLGSAFIFYTIAGPYFPALLSHSGFSWGEIAYRLFSMDAIFGIVLDTTARFVVLFVIFGALLAATGAGKFFVEFPYALTAGYRGGPAKAAVVASGFFGMISGSATANTAATGAFTIPLMKKAGFRPEVAGGIEPAASTGGMFMPPVMGAGVFIMAELIGIPYSYIITVALAPAVIYFVSVAVMVHFEAGKENIALVPRSERQNPWELLRTGWIYLSPLVIIIGLLIWGFSAGYAVYWSILSMCTIFLFTSLLRNSGTKAPTQTVKETFVAFGKGLEQGAYDSLLIGAVVGTVGIILGVISLTGLGFIFATSIFELTFGLLPIAILLAFCTAYVLGMGMTVTSAYILLAALVAPALIRMGVEPLAAHMLIFWYSQTSNISPPVALAAFVGAGIAKSDPFKTGFVALRFAAFLFVMPLLFVYSPILMPDGLTWSAIAAMITALVATIPIGSSLTGYLFGNLGPLPRAVLLISGVALLMPGDATRSDEIGMAAFAAVFLYRWYRSRRVATPKKVSDVGSQLE
jgi:TRAP transporter 4TM/12TM fusion protein